MDAIVEKLAWKHRVLPNEVEEVLTGQRRIFKKETGKVDGEHLYNALGRTRDRRYLSPKVSDFSFFIVENHNVGVRFIEPER